MQTRRPLLTFSLMVSRPEDLDLPENYNSAGDKPAEIRPLYEPRLYVRHMNTAFIFENRIL